MADSGIAELGIEGWINQGEFSRVDMDYERGVGYFKEVNETVC